MPSHDERLYRRYERFSCASFMRIYLESTFKYTTMEKRMYQNWAWTLLFFTALSLNAGFASNLKNASVKSFAPAMVSTTDTFYVVHVPEFGQLNAQIPESHRSTLTRLKVTGVLNSSDFAFIRSQLPLIQDLDLSGTDIQNKKLPDWALSSKSSLHAIDLPNDLTTIGQNAFSGCSALKGIKMPDSLLVVENGAFSSSALTSLQLPDKLATIYEWAFASCPSLIGKLELPASVQDIRYGAFSNTNYFSCKSLAVVPPVLGDGALGSISVAFVPAVSVEAYQTAWPNTLIVNMDSTATVSVTVTSPGMLGDAILEKTEYLRNVNRLIVAGPLNQADMDMIRINMPSLYSLNLKAANLTYIPESQFSGKSRLLDIVLPDSLKIIYPSAFSSCYALTEIQIPSGVTEIKSNAFNSCSYLHTVGIPASLVSIEDGAFAHCSFLSQIQLSPNLTNLGEYAFYECNSLPSITLPPGVKLVKQYTFHRCLSLSDVNLSNEVVGIDRYAFYQCAMTSLRFPSKLKQISEGAFSYCPLKSLELPTGLQRIENSAFSYTSLDSVIMPSTLMYIGNSAFAYCLSMRRIICNQATPPVLTSDPFVGSPKSTCELVVPRWSALMYKQATFWIDFANISLSDQVIDYLPVSYPLSLSNNVRPAGVPDVTLLKTGNLLVRGNAPFNIDKFTMEPCEFTGWCFNGEYYWSYTLPTLVNDCPAMKANDVALKFTVNANRWYYFTFPFDVAVGQVTISNDAAFVFRKYDGAARAVNGAGNSWKTMTADSVLKSGQGYIFQCSVGADVNIPAKDSSRNLLFASTTWNSPLKRHLASTFSDQSWNLTGNPYPAFFDSRYIDFTAPITVWNGDNGTYSALSLTDDIYVLKPFEAFFVQRPEDLNQLSLLASGRQLYNQPAPTAPYRSVQKRSSADRTLLNLTLSNETYTDKCRVVLNPVASLAYEMNCDASKFMSTQLDVPQVYTISSEGVQYAINERPLENGSVSLGFYAGSAGSYKLALASALQNEETALVLVDKLMKTETALTTNGYAFSTEKGSFNNRFELKIVAAPTTLSPEETIKTTVLTQEGTIRIRTKVGNDIRLYSMNGLQLRQLPAVDEWTVIPVKNGLYLVQVAGETFKSVVF